MIKKVKISNFRSIAEQEIELSKINVIYGGTATGKSSILYSLIVLKNFVKNPGQKIDGFFNLGFLNLGGFDDSVFNHEKERKIRIGFSTENGEYELYLKNREGGIKQKVDKIEMNAEITLPYSGNKNFSFDFEQEYTINWNSINSNVIPKIPSA